MEQSARRLARDRAAFDAQIDAMLRTNAGQFVVFKDGDLQGFYPLLEDAYEAALARFGLDADVFIARVERPGPIIITMSWHRGTVEVLPFDPTADDLDQR